MTISENLLRLIGRELPLRDVNRSLADFARSQRAPTIGAMQICCADESERETREAFQKHISDRLLPELKFWSRSAFALRNLGARYETGALAIGEQHFSTEESKGAFKVMLIKINSHVSRVEGPDGGLLFGRMARYDSESCYCGAIDAVLNSESKLPFVAELRETFQIGKLDRLRMLRNPKRVAPEHRALFGAICNSILQTRRLLEDLGNHQPTSPTLYLICSGVTLNQPKDDTEVVTQITIVDYRSAEAEISSEGLGDDPRAYRLSELAGRIRIDELP